PRAGLAALAALDDSLPRHAAVAAYLHERDGDPTTANRRIRQAQVFGEHPDALALTESGRMGSISRAASPSRH
ncbi:hypothetical protein ACFYW6_36930, partial [Streptomyces sp. NPDC002659]